MLVQLRLLHSPNMTRHNGFFLKSINLAILSRLVDTLIVFLVGGPFLSQNSICLFPGLQQYAYYITTHQVPLQSKVMACQLPPHLSLTFAIYFSPFRPCKGKLQLCDLLIFTLCLSGWDELTLSLSAATFHWSLFQNVLKTNTWHLNDTGFP